METIDVGTFLELVKALSIKQFVRLCQTNKYFHNICIQYQTLIWNWFLRRDFLLLDKMDHPKEVYNTIFKIKYFNYHVQGTPNNVTLTIVNRKGPIKPEFEKNLEESLNYPPVYDWMINEIFSRTKLLPLGQKFSSATPYALIRPFYRIISFYPSPEEATRGLLTKLFDESRLIVFQPKHYLNHVLVTRSTPPVLKVGDVMDEITIDYMVPDKPISHDYYILIRATGMKPPQIPINRYD